MHTLSICTLNFLAWLTECSFFVCFILREIFDELLETEKNSQALSMDAGKTSRQASWRADSWVGSAHCACSLTATRLTFPLPEEPRNSVWCGSNKQLRAKPKDENCNCVQCSMLIVLWKLWSHLYSWLSSISPTKVALPFVFKIYVVNIYICIYMYIHTYMRNEWSLKRVTMSHQSIPAQN